MEAIYLDNAATTPIADEVRAAMAPFLAESFGNPSSRHPIGIVGAEAIERARGQVARATGGAPDRVVFTSGGTEANNLAVIGLARARRRFGRHVLIGPTEHPCVRDAALALRDEGFEVEVARLDSHAGLDVDDLAERLREDTVLVAQMLVNNEFGTIYPVARLARIVRANAPDAFVHTDAVQGLGKLPVSIGELGVHSLAISAHKFHGPKGGGALVLAEGVQPRPLLHGGGQEHGLRSGTQNVAAIVGLGAAAQAAAARCAANTEHARALRERLREGLAGIAGARLLEPGGPDAVAPAIAAVVLPGPPAEVWMHHLEVGGVMSSVGSACQANKGGISPALLALGFDQAEARRVLRLSFSRYTTAEEVDRACAELRRVEPTLRGATAR